MNIIIIIQCDHQDTILSYQFQLIDYNACQYSGMYVANDYLNVTINCADLI